MVGAPSWEVTPLHGFPGDTCPVELGKLWFYSFVPSPFRAGQGRNVPSSFPSVVSLHRNHFPVQAEKGFLCGCFVMVQLGLV